jgi:aspartyl-tRNA(Asn)/glutamyl-tRNA(Gln) amidotransferase subunit A
MSLCDLSARDAAALVRRRELSPVDLVRALLERIERLEPTVQAWETLDAEGALLLARERERELFAGAPLGPLHGVPVGVKDIFFTLGLRTTAGFAPYDRFVPPFDAAAVARLRAAGAIILGKTVTTQFAYTDPPRTRNPWDRARTPGGSSSGSAAAVAARMAPLALGSQTAGSVLRPAAYCGVVGLKPTFGRISRSGVFPDAWTLDHVGVIARSAADCALALGVLAGYDPRDPSTVDRPVDDYVLYDTPLYTPRIAVLPEFVERAAPAVRAHNAEVVRALASADAVLDEVRLPVPVDLLLAVHQVTMQSEMAAVHAPLLAQHADAYAPRLRAYVEAGQLIPAAAYLHAQRLRRRARSELDLLLERYDALLLPTASNVAPDPSTTGDPTFQAPWTLLGLPAISLPTGLSAEGLPFGTQLVGARWNEAGLLALARWVETRLPAPALPD